MEAAHLDGTATLQKGLLLSQHNQFVIGYLPDQGNRVPGHSITRLSVGEDVGCKAGAN